MLRKFRVPVPTRPPKKAITDSRGRKWTKVEPKEEDEEYFIEWDGVFLVRVVPRFRLGVPRRGRSHRFRGYEGRSGHRS